MIRIPLFQYISYCNPEARLLYPNFLNLLAFRKSVPDDISKLETTTTSSKQGSLLSIQNDAYKNYSNIFFNIYVLYIHIYIHKYTDETAFAATFG